MLVICNLMKLPRWGVLLFLVGLAACASGLKDTVVIERNQAEISERVKKELTYEEVQLLNAYAARTAPDLEPGQLPLGRSVGEMIEAQRDFEGGDQAETRDQARTPQGEQRAVAEPVASPPPPATAVVPAGAVLEVRLQGYLSTKTSQMGETFETHLDEDLMVDGQLMAPIGSRVMGRVTHLKKSGKVKGLAQMGLTLQKIVVGDEEYPLQSNSLEYESASTKKEDAKKVGIGAGVGALIGAIAGGKKGAAIGTAVGAGAGTGAVLVTSGEEIEFKTEHRFEFTLEREVEMKIVRN